jgi:sortase A
MNAMPQALTLRRFNNGLTVVVVLLAAYMILLPFLPGWAWWLHHDAPLISKPATISVPATDAAPSENTLYLPDLAMKAQVFEGTSVYTLHYGAWHIPQSSTPDKGGNTVIAAHRHTKTGPGVFYNLDKLKKGDEIYMYWNKQRYDYVVSSVRVVPPTEVSVQGPTKNAVLTLYTCTPLWSFTDRLVVRADLKEPS